MSFNNVLNVKVLEDTFNWERAQVGASYVIVFEALLFTRHAKIMSAEVKCVVIIIVGSVGQSGLLITC